MTTHIRNEKGICRPILRYYCDTYLDRLRKTTETFSHDSLMSQP
jgi:hypothetical protein